MKQTYTFLQLILIISLIFSCSPKETFYLAKGTGSFELYKQKHSPVLEKPLISTGSKFRGGVAKTGSDSIPLLASVEADQNAYSLLVLKKELPAAKKAAGFRIASKSQVPKQLRQLKKMQKVVSKRFLPKPEEEAKPVHKLARLGLGFSVAGLGLLLLMAIVPSVSIIGLLAFLSAIAGAVISKKALNDIKSKPEEYSGKGKAQAGFIIGLATSILLLLALIIAIIVLVAFLGSYIG